jgi:uncharacterized protein (DUF1697 family)
MALVTMYVALLRGINVGKNNRIAMADLRRVVESLGHTDVATYSGSGNVVFRSDDQDDDSLGSAIEAAIAGELGAKPRVLVRSCSELAHTAAANPFGDELDPKKVHVVFLAEKPTKDQVKATKDAEREATAQGGRDRVELVGRAAYLHTPDGLGRSVLAGLLEKRAGAGTARNWATVTKLLEMCGERG